MTDMNVFSIDLHAMPCTNRCCHCWTNGSPKHGFMPVEQVFFVLEKLAQVCKHIPQGAFFLYDEPTLHPQISTLLTEAVGRECAVTAWLASTTKRDWPRKQRERSCAPLRTTSVAKLPARA